MRLRVGLVGLGDAWQQRHAPALHALADRFEVRAVFDQVVHRAEQAAAEFAADVVDGYRTLAAREDLDAVLILSPQWFGALPVLAACESGKAVYCTIGPNLTPQEAQQIKQCVQHKPVTFAAELPCRYAPATLRLKELIASRLGAVELLFCHQRSESETSSLFSASACPSQELPLRQLIELVDWCCYVVGREAKLVTGLIHRSQRDGAREDYRTMSLDFSDPASPGTAAVAQISCGRYIPDQWPEATGYRPPAELQVSCRRGVAFVDLPSTLVWFDEAGRHQELLDSERPVGEQMLSRFHRIVTAPRCRVSDIEDACRALTIVQQAQCSHLEGRRMEL